MDLELRGKVAIVTGGSRGIGRAIARELAREGADVAIAARDEARLEHTATALAAETGRTIVPLTYDASQDDSVRAMVDAAAAALGGIDILVNSAARADVPPHPTLDRIDDNAFWSDINVKVMGYIRCIREVVPYMEQRGGGRIVSIAGTSAFKTGSTIGSMRNIAVVAMTKNLADELAPKNIRLNAVHPGGTRTERTPDTVAAFARIRGTSEVEAEAALSRTSLLGRLVEAEEIAYVAAFLASPKSAAINGDAIPVAGGTPGVIRY